MEIHYARLSALLDKVPSELNSFFAVFVDFVASLATLIAVSSANCILYGELVFTVYSVALRPWLLFSGNCKEVGINRSPDLFALE